MVMQELIWTVQAPTTAALISACTRSREGGVRDGSCASCSNLYAPSCITCIDRDGCIQAEMDAFRLDWPTKIESPCNTQEAGSDREQNSRVILMSTGLHSTCLATSALADSRNQGNQVTSDTAVPIINLKQACNLA